MNKAELIAEYKLANSLGKQLLRKIHDKDLHKSALATIEMNSYTYKKNYLLSELGKLEVKT